MYRPKPLETLPLATLLVLSVISPAIAQDKVLKGGVQATGKITSDGGLHRPTDTNRDEFDPGGGGTLTPPASAFKAPPVTKAPRKGLRGNVDQDGPAPGGQFVGTPETPSLPSDQIPLTGDSLPYPTEQPQAPPQQPAYNPNDPDSSPDMQLAWDAWHKRVASTIFERFNFFARAAFRHSPPLAAEVSYVVTRDGHITNLQMSKKSGNVLFNVLVFQSVKSLDGDFSVLQFPQGSRRMYVQKGGNFTQNYGPEGFRFTTNDKETIHPNR